MTTLTALLIDDEPAALRTLGGMIQNYCPQLRVIASVSTVAEAVQSIVELKPQVIFLDIEMHPQGNGFQVLEQTLSHQYGIIFTTAYPQYAAEAINKFQPWGYLTKPYDIITLISVVNTCAMRIQQQLASETDSIIRAPRGIIIPDLRKGNQVIMSKDILYCEADGSSTHVVVLRQNKIERITASRILKDIEAEFPNCPFCRTHHSYLVNMIFIERYEKNGRGGVAYLQGGLKIDISGSKMETFEQAFKAFLSAG
jgi:two-component system, LytTR family, response regulator